MAEVSYDLIVIGAGPGGYVAAIRAAQLGLKTACVEKRDRLGGTCLNIGCIPSKALLHSSGLYHQAVHGLEGHGVKADKVVLDLETMLARKDKVVDDLTKGIAFLFKKNKIDHLTGTGRISSKGKVAVKGADGKETEYAAMNILIATGSEVAPLPGVEIDEKRIVSSTGALALSEVPKKLLIVGAGYIGLEMGSVWGRLGAEVTVVEFLDRITPGMDSEIAKNFQRVLKKQGIKFKLGTKVTAAKAGKDGVTVTLEPAKGVESETLEVDTVLVAIGRRPFTEGLGLKEAGIELDRRGFIQTDEHFRSTAEGVWAIGDCRPGPMLAHKAEEEGVAVAEIMAGQPGHVNYDACPGIVYTNPEVASVGKTEDQLKDGGVEYKTGKFPFSANSRARANGETDGLVKVLADAKTDRVLGVHILGADAGTVIHEAVAAIEYGASAEDLARTFHGHPTLNEAVMEAALDVAGRAIHI